MGTRRATTRTEFRRVHTRKIDRSVAKHGMKIMGIHRPVKSGYFRKNWREYANVNVGG